MSTSNFDWKNALTIACGLGAAICTTLGQYATAGGALPWHVTAAMLAVATAIFGNISHSLLGSTGAKDMLGSVAPGAPPDVKAAALSEGKTLMPAAPSQAATVPSKPPPPMFPKTMLVVLIGLGAMRYGTGCISSAPVVPVTPQNQAQVSSCQGIASLHNGVVIGDFVVGGATAGLAGVSAAVTDSHTKNDLAIAAAITGALGMAGTAIAGFTASDFAGSNCSSVVGPLVMAKKPEAAQ